MLLEARSTSSVSPDGKQTVVNGVDFFRMQDGRQAEHWVDRICSASWCSWASCPDRVRRDQARPPSAVTSYGPEGSS